MTLSELHNGDIFVHANCTRKTHKKYVVYGNPVYNSRHGSPTRECLNNENKIVGKSCRLEVKKIGESIHAERIKAKFDTPKK